MNWRGIELERDGQGWRATEDGVFLLVVPLAGRRAGWLARVEAPWGSAVGAHGKTPEAAIAECDKRCREVAAGFMKGLV